MKTDLKNKAYMWATAELQVFLWTTGGLCHTDNVEAAGLVEQGVLDFLVIATFFWDFEESQLLKDKLDFTLSVCEIVRPNY